MGIPFIINIDFSAVLCSTNEPRYIMLIDDSKMTLVYELAEWIRWVFSLEDCFFLTHENSVIHELEDIEVLSKLNNIEVKPCGQVQCIHKQLYRTLLSKLNLFVNWNDTKVPKYFAEKLSLVKQKSIKENLFEVLQQSNPENSNSFLLVKRPQVSNFVMDVHLPRTFNERFSEKQMEKHKKVETVDYTNNVTNEFSKQENYVEDYSTGKSNESENIRNKLKLNNDSFYNVHLKKGDRNSTFCTTDNEFNINSEEKSKISSSFFPNQQKIENPNLKKKPKYLESKKISENDKSTSKSRTSSCGKPFSLFETLINLKKELKETEASNTLDPCTSLSEAKEESDEDQLNKGNSDICYSSQNFKERKKRKRKRQRKKYLFNSEISTTFEDGSINTCKKKKVSDSMKPNHIRFNIDDEISIVNEESSEIKKYNKKQYDICNESNKRNSENLKSSVDEIMSLINDKKQILADSKSMSTIIGNDNTKIGCLTPTNHMLSKVNSLNFNKNDSYQSVTPLKESKVNCFNDNLDILFQLKQKFPCPVIIERF